MFSLSQVTSLIIGEGSPNVNEESCLYFIGELFWLDLKSYII